MTSGTAEPGPAGTKRARYPAFVRLSLAWNVAGAVALAAAPGRWPWIAGAVLADHLAVVGAGLTPRSRLLGPNRTHLAPAAAAAGQVALTFDDGPDPDVTPRVLDVLDARGVSATFFCIGRRAARHPEIVREIVARGHEVENHSWSHRVTFFFFTPHRMDHEVRAAQQLLGELTGRVPRYFRAPAGIRGPLLQPVLARNNVQLASWTWRAFDTLRTDPVAVAARLTGRIAAGDIVLLHDGHAPRLPGGRPVVLETLPRVLDALDERKLRVVPLGRAAGEIPAAIDRA